MKVRPQQGRPQTKLSLRHHCNFAPPPCQFQPSSWVCCSPYLKKWNKVVLFQVITARLGQEVHKFRSIIVTGLQSSGEEEKSTAGCEVAPSLALYSFNFELY